MISVKQHLTLENGDFTSSFLRVILMFLETASLHAVQFDPVAAASYRSSLRSVREQFEESSTVADMMLLAGKAIHTMELYNREAERFLRAHTAEMHSITGLLNEALIKSSCAGPIPSQTLRRLQKELDQASNIEEIRTLKNKMTVAISALGEEPVRPGAGSPLSSLAQNAHLRVPSLLDEVTGLPGLRKAEERIRELLAAGKSCYGLVLFLERMDTINKRFGFQIGDQILESFSRATQERLAPTDELFRWRGPCFLALLNRTSGFDAVRSEVSRIASARLEQAVETTDRSILLSLSRAWTLVPISPGTSVAEVVSQIDAFAAEQTRLATIPR